MMPELQVAVELTRSRMNEIGAELQQVAPGNDEDGNYKAKLACIEIPPCLCG